MKKYMILLTAFALFLASCVEEEFLTAKAGFDVYSVTVENGVEVFSLLQKTMNTDGTESLEVSKNQQLEFRNTGLGTHFSIWVGVGTKDYFKLASNAQGDDFPLTAKFRYKYSASGDYKLVVWATSLNSNDPSEYSRDNKVCNIKVAD